MKNGTKLLIMSILPMFAYGMDKSDPSNNSWNIFSYQKLTTQPIILYTLTETPIDHPKRKPTPPPTYDELFGSPKENCSEEKELETIRDEVQKIIQDEEKEVRNLAHSLIIDTIENNDTQTVHTILSTTHSEHIAPDTVLELLAWSIDNLTYTQKKPREAFHKQLIQNCLNWLNTNKKHLQ